MEVLPTVEQKTVKVEKTEGLFKVDIVIEELALELDLLARCMDRCGNDAELMKQEVSRRVRGMQGFLSRAKEWE